MEDEPFLDALDSDDDLPFFDCFLEPQPQPSSVLRRRRHRPSPLHHPTHTLKLDPHTSQPPSSTITDDPIEESIKPHTHTHNGGHNIPAQVQTPHHGHGHGQFSFHVIHPQPPNGDQDHNIHDHGHFSFLLSLAEFLVKAIAFQFNLLIAFITFPLWAFYYSFLFALNPLRSLTRFRRCMVRKLTRLWSHVWKSVAPFVRAWFHEHKALLDLVLRCGWGLFWSLYVCCVLVVLLISGFVVSGVLMKCYLLQEPFQLKQGLNFDYTKTKPVAFVPITSCPTQLQDWGTQNMSDFGEGDDGGIRVIPPNQDLQASVSLVLPESGYNRHLGIFQIRLDFLSEKGKCLGSVSHPGMLEFRSKPIRVLSTLLKVIPLVAGYVSEAQTLELKFRGYREGYIPTACIKVTIEQRAEFWAGAGIPEVYDADLYLESQLPFLKRMLWYWRRTLFVWLSMLIFVMELLIGLVCCRPIILPRTTTQGNTSRNSRQTSPSVLS